MEVVVLCLCRMVEEWPLCCLKVAIVKSSSLYAGLLLGLYGKQTELECYLECVDVQFRSVPVHYIYQLPIRLK